MWLVFPQNVGYFLLLLFREDDFPDDAVFLLGTAHEKWHKRFTLNLPNSKLYISYSKGMINSSDTNIAVWKSNV